MQGQAEKNHEAPTDYLVDPAMPFSNVDLTLVPDEMALAFTAQIMRVVESLEE